MNVLPGQHGLSNAFASLTCGNWLMVTENSGKIAFLNEMARSVFLHLSAFHAPI